MVDTNFRGPVNSMGSLEIQAGTTASIEPLDGPSMSYQGDALADYRGAPFAKDGFRPGQQAAFLTAQTFYSTDAVPQAASTSLLAAATVATASTAWTLTSAPGAAPTAGQAWLACGVPLMPLGTSTVTTVIALDFGFTTGTTTANSSTIAAFDNTQFTLGQWVTIGNVANAAGTSSIITQVLSISTNGTTITVGPTLPQTTMANAPIGGANLFGATLIPPATQFGPSGSVPNAHSKRLAAGLAAVWNPREAACRNVSVTASTATNGTAQVIVTGYDVHGALMTEMLTASGTTTVFGKKAFKYIVSAVPQQTQGASFTLGVGDTFGMTARADEWEQTEIYWKGSSMTTSNGFSTAVTTSPATNTTGDVRGTVQLSTNGSLATSVAGAGVSNNTSRLVIVQNVGVWNTIYATPNNLVPFYGVPQSTT